MSNFDQAIEHILEIEGGFVNDPDDRGGATKYGITLGFYRKYVDSSATVQDIKNLTRSEAKTIYRKYFWTPAEFRVDDFSYGDLPDGVGSFVLSMSINAGWKRGHLLLQRAIRASGADISVDGWLGEETVNGAESVDAATLVQWLGTEAAVFYAEIVLNDRSQHKFLRGWMRRAFSETVRSVQNLNNKHEQDGAVST